MEGYGYVLGVVSENSSRALQRLIGVFARHQIKIETLVVNNTTNLISNISIVIQSKEAKARLIVKQLSRIVEVKDVNLNLNFEKENNHG